MILEIGIQLISLLFRMIKVLVFVFLSAILFAHEETPGYVTLREVAPFDYHVTFRQPNSEPLSQQDKLSIIFSDTCNRSQSTSRRSQDLLIDSFRLHCDSSEHYITGTGFNGNKNRIFVYLETVDSNTTHFQLTETEPSSPLSLSTPSLGQYFVMGIEHLIFGYDHLIFLLGLLFLLSSTWGLIKVITAFTIAHSISLALSVFQWVTLPPMTIEALIALTIVYLAYDILRQQTNQSSLVSRYPERIVFGFGLLHGFGFASMILDIGFPDHLTALALLLFNLGIEFGQLIVIFPVLLLLWLFNTFFKRFYYSFVYIIAIFIGSISFYWFLSRSVYIFNLTL